MTEKDLERVMKALANRRRLAIVRYLKKTKKAKEATVGDIATEIKLSFKATSKHLGILFGVGILDREQKSLQIYYTLSSAMPEAARRIIQIL